MIPYINEGKCILTIRCVCELINVALDQVGIEARTIWKLMHSRATLQPQHTLVFEHLFVTIRCLFDSIGSRGCDRPRRDQIL